MPYVLPPAPQRPRKPRVRTRDIALLYLPTIGAWSLLRAVRFYMRNRLG